MPNLRAQAKAKTSTTKKPTTASSLRTKAASRPKTPTTNSSPVMEDAQKAQEDNYKPPKFNIEVPASSFGYLTMMSKIPGLRKRSDAS